jgi:hypothetical protein
MGKLEGFITLAQLACLVLYWSRLLLMVGPDRKKLWSWGFKVWDCQDFGEGQLGCPGILHDARAWLVGWQDRLRKKR